MKTIYTFVFAALLFISCGEKKTQTIEEIIATQDITIIKAKKTE
jgi:membrane fusion protein, multidrug efflux system